MWTSLLLLLLVGVAVSVGAERSAEAVDVKRRASDHTRTVREWLATGLAIVGAVVAVGAWVWSASASVSEIDGRVRSVAVAQVEARATREALQAAVTNNAATLRVLAQRVSDNNAALTEQRQTVARLRDVTSRLEALVQALAR
jgi:Mn2+/Fe2+ NRAMP family transporter